MKKYAKDEFELYIRQFRRVKTYRYPLSHHRTIKRIFFTEDSVILMTRRLHGRKTELREHLYANIQEIRYVGMSKLKGHRHDVYLTIITHEDDQYSYPIDYHQAGVFHELKLAQIKHNFKLTITDIVYALNKYIAIIVVMIFWVALSATLISMFLRK